MTTRRVRAACLAIVASALLSCIKPNPAFVDTQGSESGADTTTTTGCTDDAVSDPDSEADAVDLGTVAPGAPPGAAEGVLTPDTASWWFAFATSTTSGAGRIVATLAADTSSQLCVFIECVDAPSVPSLLCDGGTTATQSPLGRVGCCAPQSVGLLHACSSDVRVFLSVAQEITVACSPFRIEYRVTEPGG